MKKKLDPITQKYLSDNSDSFYALNSLENAVQNYIQIREGWGDGRSKYGWRGSGAGMLFFSRRKTTNNIRVMYQVLAVIDDDYMTFQQKIRDIKMLKTQLSAKGVGGELLETFLAIALDETSSYIPKSLDSDLESSVYVDRGQRFQRDKVIGKGVYGEVSRFQTPGGTQKLVIKQIHDDKANKDELQTEADIFQTVYDHLGKLYFGFEAHSKVMAEQKHLQHLRFVMPEIPGTSIGRFIENNKKYDEIMLFSSVFNFLWSLHDELQITHGDCHIQNIIVLDGLYNVFFIDHGMTYHMLNETISIDEKNKLLIINIHKDLAMAITNIFVVHFKTGKSQNLSLKELSTTYNLKRWRNKAFASCTMETTVIQNVNKMLSDLFIPRILNA